MGLQGREMTERHSGLSPITTIIDEARNGRMFILVDDDDRENEGDLIVPAQMATPEKINFMAKHGRGLICLALTRQRVDELRIPPMSALNQTPLGTAFTVSIEARDGITTGISAADRARTVSVAIDASKGADDLLSPGHVFPLVARDGGVLVRAGHTEAAVDVARLAGLNPSGVICEIMKSDGTMARRDDLVAFAEQHDLKVGTIRDLIAYRLRNDHLVSRRDEAQFTSHWGGDWRAFSFTNMDVPGETIAVVKGDLTSSRTPLVRMHVVDVFSDAMGGVGPRDGLVQGAMQAIAENGCGIFVMLRRDAPISAVVGAATISASEDSGALRDYGVGAQVLAELGVQDMILLSNSDQVPVALAGFGLNIVEVRRFAAAETHLPFAAPAGATASTGIATAIR